MPMREGLTLVSPRAPREFLIASRCFSSVEKVLQMIGLTSDLVQAGPVSWLGSTNCLVFSGPALRLDIPAPPSPVQTWHSGPARIRVVGTR